MTPIRHIIISPLPRQVDLGVKKRPKYYKLGKSLPLKIHKFIKSGVFSVTREGYVINKKSGLKVRIPSKTNSNLISINGQNVYNGTLNPINRSKFILAVKTLLKPFFKSIKPIDPSCFPVKMTGFLYISSAANTNWDVDNLWIYTKVIQDILVDLGVIPNDNVKYITHPMSMQVVFEDSISPDRLEIYIDEDTLNPKLKKS